MRVLMGERTADLPPDLSVRLRIHRAAVLGLLVDEYAPAGDGAEVLAERLGIADELGMPTDAGSAAWLVAVGEAMPHSCRATTNVVHCGHGTTTGCDSGGG